VNHVVQTGLFDVSHKAFRDRLQIGGTCRQTNRFDARSLKDHPDILAEQAGAIMDEIAAAAQEPFQAIGQIASHLLHPPALEFRDDSCDVNLPRRQLLTSS
jgi:hypothetical protein